MELLTELGDSLDEGGMMPKITNQKGDATPKSGS